MAAQLPEVNLAPPVHPVSFCSNPRASLATGYPETKLTVRQISLAFVEQRDNQIRSRVTVVVAALLPEVYQAPEKLESKLANSKKYPGFPRFLHKSLYPSPENSAVSC